MPVYEYHCLSCHNYQDIRQGIYDPAIETCRYCGKPWARVIQAVGVIFRGTGFHVNDYPKK